MGWLSGNSKEVTGFLEEGEIREGLGGEFLREEDPLGGGDENLVALPDVGENLIGGGENRETEVGENLTG